MLPLWGTKVKLESTQSTQETICYQMPKHMLETFGITAMRTERQVRLLKNGRNQALRIPRDFELPGDEAIIRKEGNRLVLEPIARPSLPAVLVTLEPLN